MSGPEIEKGERTIRTHAENSGVSRMPRARRLCANCETFRAGGVCDCDFYALLAERDRYKSVVDWLRVWASDDRINGPASVPFPDAHGHWMARYEIKHRLATLDQEQP